MPLVRRWRAVFLLPLLVCLLDPLPARAQLDRSFDLMLLQPAADGHGLVAVEGAQTNRRTQLDLSALVGYVHAPLQLPLTDPDKNISTHALVMGQATLHLGLSFGLTDYLEIAATVPVAAQWYDAQAVGSPAAVPKGGTMVMPTGIYRGLPQQNIALANAGPGDVRFVAKGRLLRRPFGSDNQFGLALLLSATVPSGNSNSFLGDRNATFRPLLAADVMLGKLALFGNFGAIIRAESDLSDFLAMQPGPPIFSVSHELTWAAGAAYRFHRLAGASLESFGTIPVAGVAPSTEVDLLGAVHVYPLPGLRLLAGLGGGLVPGTPRRDEVRAVLGVSWALAPGQEKP